MKKTTAQKIHVTASLLILLFIINGCTKCLEMGNQTTAVQLLLELPSDANTPDGAALAANGDIILSIPNFNNDALMKSGVIKVPAPEKMIKIDKTNRLSTWYLFKDADKHPDTGRIGPMDCAFGPDGNLYVADMQIFWDGDRKSRLLRINVVEGEPVSMDVVVEGLIVANGMAWKGDTLFVTETILEHSQKAKEGEKKPPLLSAVYAFTLQELNRGKVILPAYDKSHPDEHLVNVFTSSNRVGFGADGVTVDGQGTLYTSIIEDGVIYKTTFNKNGEAIKTILFAKSKKMISADGIVWNEADNKIYVADFLGNGVHSVDMNGKVITLHKNGDTNGAHGMLDEPCEVIIRGNELIIVNMDMPFENPYLVNTEIDKPYTLSVIQLHQ